MKQFATAHKERMVFASGDTANLKYTQNVEVMAVVGKYAMIRVKGATPSVAEVKNLSNFRKTREP